MAEYGNGFPVDISNLNRLFGFEQPRTNGFLMRNVDGRVPAIKLPIGRMSIEAGSVLADDEIVPWGHGLWRNIATTDTSPGTLHTQKPVKGVFVGILKFNQGWQAGQPIVPWGVPVYSKGVAVNKGPVGYKHALAAIGKEAEYLEYLKGDKDADKADNRTTYKEWIAAYKAAADGARLGLFFANESGFPIVSVVLAANQAAPALSGATFAGFALDEFQPEHSAIYFNINTGI
jgi:hypothetical protein